MVERVQIEHLTPRWLAAVRRTALPRDTPRLVRRALDLVWAFLAKHPGLRTDGPNVFLYHDLRWPEGWARIDFGVEVTRRFDSEGEVRCVETPAGEAAVLGHRGPYGELPKAHAALRVWCAANKRTIGAHILEVYGDWSEDPSKLETTIQYLLR
jgi:effector-binding domain-containing protein